MQRDHSRLTVEPDARSRAQEPARTHDGTLVSVLANIACLQDTLNAPENGADGIGLYRTEGVYLGCAEPPDTDALYEHIRGVLDPAKTKPICVRLLDAGGDKPLPYIGAAAEPNPALGSRGIRLLFEHRELLETQLRALLLLHQELPLSVLVPMVTVPLDMERVAELMRELSVELRLSTVPPLGAMIETPAAALCAKAISRHADFFSVETNDLTQYALAADRQNTRVCRYFDDTPEAVVACPQKLRPGHWSDGRTHIQLLLSEAEKSENGSALIIGASGNVGQLSVGFSVCFCYARPMYRM